MLMAAGLGACGEGDDGGGTDAGGRPLLPAGSSAGGATEESAMAADAATDDGAARSMIAPAQWPEYRAGPGVEAPATEAPAYRLVPGAVSAAEVQQAIGDDGGTVDVQAGRWTFHREITVTDGDAAVSSDAGTSSEAAGSEAVARDVGVSGSAPACAPDETCPSYEPPPPPPGVPSAAEAETRFTEILEALDLDPSAGEFDTYDGDDAGPVYQRTITFRPTVGGRRVIGLEHTIAFGENGRIEWANGFAGRFEKLGDYPLVDVAEALERQRTSDGTATATATDVGVPEPAFDTPAVAEDGGGEEGARTSGSTGSGAAGQTEPGSPGAEPSTVEPVEPSEPVEAPVPTEPEIVEVTGAELVLLALWPRCEGDDLVVVPAFELSVGDEVHLTIPAVEEASMAQPDPDAPSEPCPGEEPMDGPVGRPEPAPMPPDAGGREPANP